MKWTWPWKRKKRTTRDNVPDYALPTYDMITAAFPTGIDPDLYVPLLSFLAGHMSHRNIADVIWLATGRDYVDAGVDLVDAIGTPVSDETLARLKQKLEPHGLAAWVAEP